MVRKAEDEYITDRYNTSVEAYDLAWRPMAIFGQTNVNMPKKVKKIDNFKRKISAEVNDGRWVGRCTNEACGGAQIVSPNDPRFFCTYCHNVDGDGEWLEVHFPEDWKEKEKILDRRPVRNQHMKAWETVEDLRQENRVRGL